MKANVITPYFIDDQPRDMILILPGGAYGWTSDREAIPVAKRWNQASCHAAVFYYRNQRLLYPALIDEAYSLIDRFREDPRIRRIYLCGFSAGGHFALMLLQRKPSWFAGGILCYPVVSADVNLWNERSFINLLGKNRPFEHLEEVSLEKHVPEEMCPLFVWHTLDDESVKVGNSLVLIEAVRAKNASIEAHIFPKGRHGLSLATEETPFIDSDPMVFAQENAHVSQWFEMAVSWIRSRPSS
ncbi:MAG: prolyl oligopeptidase family serine peptidase [Candidatus Izemoplasmatales bacterium]|jgi:acetyl esterase/lipase|nr:prolyl oligopeptidase family serine peptidase [Candidatus Izemoplasmatales bacterium]